MQLEQIIKEKVEQFQEVGRQSLYDRILERIDKETNFEHLTVEDLFYLSRQEYHDRQKDVNEVGSIILGNIEQLQERLRAKYSQIQSKALEFQRYQDWTLQSEQNLQNLEEALDQTHKMSVQLQEQLSLVQSQSRYLQYLQQQQQLQRRQSHKENVLSSNCQQLARKQQMQDEIRHLRLMLKCKDDQLYQSDQRKLDVSTKLKQQWVRIQQNEERVKQMQQNILCIEQQNNEMKDQIMELEGKLDKRVSLTSFWSPKSVDGTKMFMKYSYEDRNTKTVRKCISILGKGEIDYESKETVRQFKQEESIQQKLSILGDSRMEQAQEPIKIDSEYLLLKKAISYELPTMDTDMSRISHLMQDGMSSFDMQSPKQFINPAPSYFKAVKNQQTVLCKCQKSLFSKIFSTMVNKFEWLADRVVKRRIREALKRFRPSISY